jgi:hypothetical protein
MRNPSRTHEEAANLYLGIIVLVEPYPYSSGKRSPIYPQRFAQKFVKAAYSLAGDVIAGYI